MKNKKQDVIVMDIKAFQKPRASISETKLFTEILDSDYIKYNTNLPYQRENVWKENDRVNLLESLFAGRHIQSIITNKVIVNNLEGKSIKQYNIIDGKQRYTTYKDFLEGKLKYPFGFNNRKEYLSYPEIKEIINNITPGKAHNYDGIVDIKREIDSCKIEFCVYENLTYNEEQDEFDRQNLGKRLNKCERIFCGHTKCKYVFSKIWKFYIPNSITSIIKNDRYQGSEWISNIFHVFYGPELKNKKMIYDIETRADSGKDSSDGFYSGLEKLFGNSINETISDYYDKKLQKSDMDAIFSSIRIKDNLHEINFLEMINEVSFILDFVGNIFKQTKIKKSKTTLRHKMWDVIYFIKFNMDSGIETRAYLKEEREFWERVSEHYINNIDVGKIESGFHPTYLKQRKLILDKIYENSSKEKEYRHDVGIKNQEFPRDVRKFLLDESEKYQWKCPYYPNESLMNGHVNHYPPKDKSSECYPILISAKSNLEFNDATEKKSTMDFKPMIQCYKDRYNQMKNDIPVELKNIIKEIPNSVV